MTENVQLTVKDVPFDGFNLKVMQNTDDKKIFVGAKWICNGIGLSRGQSNGEIIKIQSDLVLKRGCMKFHAGVFDPNNETIAIMIDYLPLWLAKISITPRMQRETPELVEKLINYQLKAKDVLANAFLPQPAQQSLQSTNPLLEQSIMSLQTALQNLTNCSLEQGYQLASHEEQLESIQRCLQYDLLHADKMDEISEAFLNLEEQIEELRNGNSKSVETQSEPVIELSAKDIIRNTIKPLAEKLNDGSKGYNATYRKVYDRICINWKYRITRYMNLHNLKTRPSKIILIEADNKLFGLFQEAVSKLLQEN